MEKTFTKFVPVKTILLLKSDDVFYGIPTINVKEMINLGKLTIAPRQPFFMRGLCNYKNQLIPVLSLRSLCGAKGETAEENLALVLETGEGNVVLTVQAVFSVENIEAAEILQHETLSGVQDLIKLHSVVQLKTAVFVIEVEETIHGLTAYQEQPENI